MSDSETSICRQRHKYSFLQVDAENAFREWGCNCGPTALAFSRQMSLQEIRPVVDAVGFDGKRYMSPMMMRAALEVLGVWPHCVPVPVRNESASFREIDHHWMFPAWDSPSGGMISLVRVQWAGPWTQPGANPKWAYRQTHWIACWSEKSGQWVFDCNGGINSFESWQQKIVPFIVETVARADGNWFPTHVWRLPV